MFITIDDIYLLLLPMFDWWRHAN